MADDQFLDEDVLRLSARIRDRDLGVQAVVRATLDRIETRDPGLHAFVKVLARSSERRARDLDAELARGYWRGPLHGLPVAVKDIVDIEGEVTGFGSRCYPARPAERTAACIASLEAAGAVIVGKTQMVEFAYGSWGTNHGLGTPVNPAVAGHASPGGSSSGSAVAVAGGLVPLAIGSDTGGSVRIPAALCGVAGLKPSHGLVSLDGVAPLSPALDTVGPIARDVAGLRLLMRGLRPDWEDTEAGTVPETVWTLRDADLAPMDPNLLGAYGSRIAALGSAGVETRPFPLPLPLGEYQRLCGEMMAFDAYRALAPLVEDRRLPMDPWVRRRIALGRGTTLRDRRTAEARRADDIARFLTLFGANDVLFLPATPLRPQRLDAIDETEMPMSRFTRIANYLDLCAVTVPAPRSSGSPLGMQLIARSGRDCLILSAFSTGYPFGDLV